MKRLLSLLCIIVAGTLIADTAYAGFGITPPYVRNTSLVRNSVYEQTILLVRSDPITDLRAQITVDVPGINDWFTVVEGEEFILPRGEQRVPMTVRVTVPDDAEFKNYTGAILVRTSSAGGDAPAGSVSIALGAQIDVDLTVIDKEIEDFRVRRIGVEDLNAGHKLGWLYFPGKINFDMLIENTGNVEVRPSDIVFRIYDSTGQILLEETRHTNRIKKIKPFLTEDVRAELPTRLPSGSYIARYAIYNGEEVKQEGEVSLSILPYGTLQTAGYGFMGLSLAHKLSVLIPLFVVLSSISALLVYRSRQSPKGETEPIRRRSTKRKP